MRFVVALMLILSMNMFFFMAQIVVQDVRGEVDNNPVTFFQVNKSMIAGFNQGTNGNYLLEDNVSQRLPSTAMSMDQSQNNFWFFNIFQSVGQAIKGVGGFIGGTVKMLFYLQQVVTAFPNFLGMMGLPSAIIFALGFFWYALCTFLLVRVMMGGD